MLKNGTRILVRIAVMTVVIIICSWISIPLVVPFTLQTFAVFLALEILGGGWGTISVSVYVLLALVGVPVMSGFKGGVGALIGPTGGFVFGFILSALVYWAMTFKIKNFFYKLFACVVALVVCYAMGTVWFWLIYSKDASIGGLISALMICVVPYVGFDLVKIFLASVIGDRVGKIIEDK